MTNVLLDSIINGAMVTGPLMTGVLLSDSYISPEYKKPKEKVLVEDTNTFIIPKEISRSLKRKIHKASKKNKLVEFYLLYRAKITHKLIVKAMRYMTNEKYLIKDVEENEKILLNTIFKLANFPLIYSKVKTLDMKEVEKFDSDFVFDKEEVLDWLYNIDFQNKMRIRMMNSGMDIGTGKVVDAIEMKPESVVEKKEQDDVKETPVVQQQVVNPQNVPIEFVDPTTLKKQVNKKGVNVSVEAYNRFEYAFAKFIPETTPYHYELGMDGYYYLYITRSNGVEEYYALDDGSIMGGDSVYIMANYIDKNGIPKNIFVDAYDYPSIVSKVLKQSIFNYLTEDELKRCSERVFYDKKVYNLIDFRDTPFIDDLDKKQLLLLETTLLGVFNLDVVSSRIRMKFESFNGPANYVLVSDYTLKRPFPYIQDEPQPETSVCEGLKISVLDKEIFVEYGGTTTKYHMNYDIK